jgi:hypothetical protein
MFQQHILDFNENIIGLRDFIDLIDPFLNEKFDEHDKLVKPLITLGIVNEMLTEKKEWEDGEMEKIQKLRIHLNGEIEKIYKKSVDIKVEFDKKETDNKEDSKSLKVIFKAQNAPSELQDNLKNIRKVSDHMELLYKNSLISLLSSVEWFFSQILHFNYDKYPESAGIQKKNLTLADLKTFGSIADAEKYLIDTKIEEILRGNLDSWFTTLKTELNLGLSYIEPIKDELIEIYQRRNLFVHNGGVVNSIYLSKVKDKYREGVKIGDTLRVDKSYLDNSICKLQKAFILVAAELWKNNDKNDKLRGGVLGDIVYENLLKSKWDICEGLTYFIINDAQMDVTDKLVAQLNYWLCKKETGDFEKIKKDLFNTDLSDRKEIFQLALFALRDEIEPFMELLPKALDAEQLTTKKLEEFPIFKNIRETGQYKSFKSTSKYFDSKLNDTK